jgi:hypothetical protein
MISPEERARVEALNERFSEFGRNPYGDLKFRWGHTTELHYFMLEMKPESEWDQVGLLAVPSYKFQAYEWAGPLGECWHLTYWQKPVPYDEWVASGRENFPWPKHGEYLCVENVGLPPGQEPNEIHTFAAIAGIRFQLELLGPTHAFDPKGDHPRLRNFIAEQKAAIAKHDEAAKRTIADDFGDGMPAFWKEPGSNHGSVSIPRRETQIIREGGSVPQGD